MIDMKKVGLIYNATRKENSEIIEKVENIFTLKALAPGVVKPV